MYTRNISRLPEEISRDEFVNIVFDLGLMHQHGCDTIVASVELGDYFVSFRGNRIPFVQLTKKERMKRKSREKKGERVEKTTFKEEVIPQVYSVELAHVVTIIIAKYNEDDGYNWTDDAIDATNNDYVIKMEWEICIMLGFHIKVRNFITLIGEIIWSITTEDERIHESSSLRLHSMFWDLSKEICMDQKLLATDPRALVMGCLLLQQRGKLRAVRINKERIFRATMNLIAHEYELDINDLLNTYIKLKKDLICRQKPRRLSKSLPIGIPRGRSRCLLQDSPDRIITDEPTCIQILQRNPKRISVESPDRIINEELSSIRIPLKILQRLDGST